MASTTFIDRETVIQASWLNDVNTAVYGTTWNPVFNDVTVNGTLTIGDSVIAQAATGAASIRADVTGSTGSDIATVQADAGSYYSQMVQYGNGYAYMQSNATSLSIGTTSAAPMYIKTNNTSQGVVTSAGLFGFGTVLPIYKVHSVSSTGPAGYFDASGYTSAGALYGVSTSNYGVVGQSSSSLGVYGISTSNAGVYGDSTSSYGVRGISATSIGGYFSTSGGTNSAIYANSYGGYGVDGRTNAANRGGVIGFADSTSYYGILGYSAGNYGGYFVGNVKMNNNAYVDGVLYNGGHTTTASAANCFINTADGRIYRSTSSLRYKKDVEPLWDDIGNKVLQLEPIFYRSNDLTDDNQEWSWYSFPAETTATIDARFALWGNEPKRDADGNIIYTTVIGPNDEELQGPAELEEELSPNGINYNAIVAALVNLVQRQEAKINDLTTRIEVLEKPAGE